MAAPGVMIAVDRFDCRIYLFRRCNRISKSGHQLTKIAVAPSGLFELPRTYLLNRAAA
jgi:hypothetical protein